ncbi:MULTISPECIES: hypothetical protein [Lysobacter]|uniref:hypothetical protein n=1 Tax=Lysobacter TaxID=68 RepID=UPI001F2A1744|nr:MULTISPECIES: hypothetical protein [Lysobacter]UJB17547.1 hypothetical protein L1A79_14305 [Lysobacter capsici]UJQ28730.1 hypothetical protein L2D09_00560 [Lysobacter gummosus]
MARTINRFGGRQVPREDVAVPDRLNPAVPSPLTVIARRCHCCNAAKGIGGGRVRIVLRRGHRVNEFTCAECCK